MAELKTYGDLKKLIKTIKLKQKGEKIISQGKEFALDQVLGLIPGASNAKTAFDFMKAAISKPDTKKTLTWLDKLDIDDDMSAIVDDTVENGFMEAMANTIESESDDKELEDDFNMNQKMVDYLGKEFNSRTITGIKENMEQQQLRQIIREYISNIIKEEEKEELTGDISTLISNLKDKKLNIDIDPNKISTTLNLVKQDKTLNNAANKIMADIMIGLIKADDISVLTKIFQNIKDIKVQ
jgi:hypothetical protein